MQHSDNLTESLAVKTQTPKTRLLGLLVKLWHHLSRRRRRQFCFLIVLMLISAFAELMSLGAVLPFLGVLIAPDRILEQHFIADMAKLWGITSGSQLVLPLTIIFALAALIAGAIRILLLWLSTRLAFASGADLSMEVYRRTLYQPYSVHIARNSSEVISGITGKVGNVVSILYQLVVIISSTILLVSTMLALMAINTVVALVAAVGFSAIYLLITWGCRRKLYQYSKNIAREQTQVVKALQEGLGGIRDVLLDGTQPVYCEIYKKSDEQLRRAQGGNNFISQSPRYVMESIGVALIAILAYKLSQGVGGMSVALPVLGALALGAQRMLPTLQQIYSSWSAILGSEVVLVDTIALLDQPLPIEMLQPTPAPLCVESAIRFNNVSFRYGYDVPWVLKGLDLTIPKGARVGFIGSTGSGKTTTLDILMGLLTPTEGELLVDDQIIAGSLVRAWQRTIAHVPQSIYLSDASMAENIAFGIPLSRVDLDRVRKAARQAQISDFIENSPDGYLTYVGERGIRLSGGQRQRIGIARALYKQASVLVFDEATSALDNATEKSVMDAIDGLSKDLTILLIAHRLTTLERCDTIVQLENGRVVTQGSYQHLIESNIKCP